MTRYRKRVIVEAITFDELVEHGKAQGVPLYDGFPRSFNYAGYPVTHENNDLYLVGALRFNRGEILVTGKGGELYTELPGSFEASYEPV